ncbi:MAG: methionyl-tRNA formyltransferase [Erysipelotrichaceae bacterium]|nr:methionyl-tRNA formyltransferase [Erysipelotrichaceae bacterium]
MENRKIIFMGTPQIAADVLQKLIDAGADICLVVTQPDKKTGRKQTLVHSPVKKLALEHDIPVFQPERIRKDFQAVIDADAALAVTCAYGQIVPEEVLNAPKHGCVNLHGSLLPLYRGAAPIQRALWDGQTKTGMALMQMEKGMDTGGVMDVAELEILPEDNTTTLFEKMGHLAGDLIVKNLDVLLSGKAVFEPQNEAAATYAAMISKEDEKIDFSKSDAQICSQIRALALQPGAWLMAGGKKLKILKASYLPERLDEFGTFVKEGKKILSLQLHDGRLLLELMQPEGKPVMKTADFMNGQGRSLIGRKIDEVM